MSLLKNPTTFELQLCPLPSREMQTQWPTLIHEQEDHSYTHANGLLAPVQPSPLILQGRGGSARLFNKMRNQGFLVAVPLPSVSQDVPLILASLP